MKYFILMPGDNEADAWLDSNLLGEKSFNVFWAGQGLKNLNNILVYEPEALGHVTVKSEDGREISVTQFFDIIDDLQVRIN